MFGVSLFLREDIIIAENKYQKRKTIENDLLFIWCKEKHYNWISGYTNETIFLENDFLTFI